eukprot:CAMPEP_0169157146 /NCGR_PEP_ID=MMETSP1015-20121227/54426_1 /TAXON_ID=342587 /ORGANISM="Karlodinium micrum, Strain CCMP2283" /LENGTH=546 /DNA_ID=CAMNT_0009228057 /DNA_START=30 /DNA_END=1666 /DNA_ORIENTATION=+
MKISICIALWLYSLCFVVCVNLCAAAALSSSSDLRLRGILEGSQEFRSAHPWHNSSIQPSFLRREHLPLRPDVIHPEGSVHHEEHHGVETHEVHHGGHAEEYEGHEGSKHGLGYSLCLFGAVAFNMSLLYLINHEDPGIIYATWQVLSMTLSIFVAVLAYATIRAISVDAIAATNEAILYVLKSPKNAKLLHSGAALGCHVLGFAACYSFADVQRAALFGTSALGNSLVVPIAALVLIGLAFVARFAHEWVETLHQAEREHLEDVKWEKETEAMEDEAVSLCMGYLFVQTIAYGIRGSHDSIDAAIAPINVSQRQVNLVLILGGVLFVFVIFGFAFANWWMNRTIQRRQSVHGQLMQANTLNYEQVFVENDVPWHVRLLMVVLHTLNVGMAWCVLLCAEWQVYSLGFEGSRIAACMLVGIVLTLLAFATIFVLEWIANHLHTQQKKAMDPKKVFRSMTLALGIVIGFAWERAFHVGLHDIAHAMTFSHAAEDFFSHLMSCCLVIIVTPAWAMYVFPMVQNSEQACNEKYENQERSASGASLSSDLR